MSDLDAFCDALLRNFQRGDDLDNGDVLKALDECEAAIVPREAGRGDGRMLHYGAGEQPWDAALRLGWAPVGAAFSILRYLRRTKTPERDLRHAKIYFTWLRELAEMDLGKREPKDGVLFALAAHVLRQLLSELSPSERARLGVPACFAFDERSEG